MKQLFLLLLCNCIVFTGAAHASEIKASTLTKAQMPHGIKIDGKLAAASRWTDKKGDNVVVLSTSSAEHNSSKDGEEGTDAQLYVSAYRKNGNTWKPVWNLWDYVDTCPLDLTCDFVKNSLEITDLDDNGVAEVSFVYRLNCAGDISDSNQKLFLVEDGKKYPLRGWVGLDIGEKQARMASHDMKVDKVFNSAPSAFRKFAVRKWKRFSSQELLQQEEQ